MPGVDTRHIARDSLFLLGELRLKGEPHTHRVKVRNLSNGGMMAEGDAQLNARVEGGAHLSIQLRNIGWVDGTVAWVQDNRFGIAFAREIDASLARAKPAQDGEHSPRFTRPSGIYTSAADPRGLRKI